MSNEKNQLNHLFIPELVPTIPITPDQETALFNLIQQVQIAIHTYRNNPIIQFLE
ncbi:hypothetical protein [Bacillus toyonensis]|uniref:hypothetical protein n=1 Tax=Bacillus toyonensis TaxID=155322 RepID=UPI0015CF22AA|nr:hypothetical protein [Bacillus toyonensis]